MTGISFAPGAKSLSPAVAVKAKLSVGNSNSEAFRPEFGAEPFPGYKLLWLRGRGGFATVWEATNPVGERIALKFMSSQNMASTAREVRVMHAIQNLEHPNLLRTRQTWCLPGYIAIAMDLAEGSMHDLANLYIEEFGERIDFEKLGLHMAQVASALDFLNTRRHLVDGRTVGFQHGDIKPSNLLLLNDRAMLSDYGMATPTSGSSTPCPRAGTPDYAAPEVFNGTAAETSDQFSLAVTYHMLRTGSLPFPKFVEPDASKRTFHRPPPNVSALPEIERPVVARALSPAPQDRYPSCVKFVNELLATANLVAVADRAGELHLQPLSVLTPTRSILVNSGAFAGLRDGD